MIPTDTCEGTEGCVSLKIDYNHQKECCNDVVKAKPF